MSIVEAITAIFTAIAGWVVEIIPTFIPIFWVAETGLTFIGTVSVISLSIGLGLLVLGVITNFIKLRN